MFGVYCNTNIYLFDNKSYQIQVMMIVTDTVTIIGIMIEISIILKTYITDYLLFKLTYNII